MAVPSSTKNELPTVWLAPPAGLLPSSHKVKIEPAPIAISSVLALLVFLIVTLIFNKRKKDIYLDDFIKETKNIDKELFKVAPETSQDVHVAVAAAQAWPKDRSRGSSMYSRHRPRMGIEDYSSDDWEDTRDFEYDTPGQTPMKAPKIRYPSPVRHRIGNFYDDTPAADRYDDDASNSEVSYGGYGHAGVMSNLDLPGYPTSYYPSEFKPLAPEDVGMHGKIWK